MSAANVYSELTNLLQKVQNDNDILVRERNMMLDQLGSQDAEIKSLKNYLTQVDSSVSLFKQRTDDYIAYLSALLVKSGKQDFLTFDQFLDSGSTSPSRSASFRTSSPSLSEKVGAQITQQSASCNEVTAPATPIHDPHTPTTLNQEQLPSPSQSPVDPKVSSKYELLAYTSPVVPLRPLLHFTFPSIVCCVAVSQDDSLIATGFKGACSIIQVATGSLTTHPLPSPNSFIRSLAFNVSKTLLLAAVEDAPLTVLDLESGGIKHLGPNGLDQKLYETTALTTSPDGKYFASSDASIRLWSMETLALVATFGSESYACVAFSACSYLLAAGGANGEIVVIDVESREVVNILKGHGHVVHALCFSQCGKFLSSVSLDKTCRVWSAATGELLTVLRHHTDFVLATCFSSCSRYLITGSKDRSICLWDTSNWGLCLVVNAHENSVIGMAGSNQSNYFVSASGDQSSIVHEFDFS
ncbi:hypothetical protein RCL1_000856 [Eukaryota sp. TZLM3-RCL]